VIQSNDPRSIYIKATTPEKIKKSLMPRVNRALAAAAGSPENRPVGGSILPNRLFEPESTTPPSVGYLDK
jgi:hypothetical protein